MLSLNNDRYLYDRANCHGNKNLLSNGQYSWSWSSLSSFISPQIDRGSSGRIREIIDKTFFCPSIRNYRNTPSRHGYKNTKGNCSREFHFCRIFESYRTPSISGCTLQPCRVLPFTFERCWAILPPKETSENDCSSRNRLEARARACVFAVSSQRVTTEPRPDFRERGKKEENDCESRERRYETADGRIDDVVISWQARARKKERKRERESSRRELSRAQPKVCVWRSQDADICW